MAYIKQVSSDSATGPVADVYRAAQARAGGIANIIRVMSNDGRALAGSMQFYVALMKAPNALDAAQREMLATVVACVNDCYY